MLFAYYHISNERAKLAVQATKRLLVENVGPNGKLKKDKTVNTLLAQRNTPEKKTQFTY